MSFLSRFFPVKRKPNAFERIWDFLTSNVLAVSLFVIFAALSVLGTVIPQKEDPQVYLKLYGEVFSNLFFFLRLNDLFSSPVFWALYLFFGASLLACTLKRLFSALRKKTNLRTWGSVAAHLSLLLVFAGALYGSIAGFSANVPIEKGSSYFEPHGKFYIKLNDFNAKFNQNGRPLVFSSDLSILENDKEVLRKTILVNSPLSYKGVKLYQSSYGLNGILEVNGPDGKTEEIPIYKGSCAVYSGSGQMFNIQELFPDLHILHGLAADTYEPTNPIAYIIAHDDRSSEHIGWLVQGKPVRFRGYDLKLGAVKEYTVLQVKKDPGLPIVYLGLSLLTVGVVLMLYFKKKGN